MVVHREYKSSSFSCVLLNFFLSDQMSEQVSLLILLMCTFNSACTDVGLITVLLTDYGVLFYCSADPLSNMCLTFSSKEEAINYAEKQGNCNLYFFLLTCY